MKIGNIEIIHPDKIIFQKEKISKFEIASYYSQVAPFMFKFLDKRLLSVIRANQGIDKVFFKKHPNVKSKFVKSVIVEKEKQPYFYLPSEESVVYQAQMGTVEFHIWASSLPKIDKPDIMTFDLDPDENLGLSNLRQGVKNLKQILDKLGLRAFLKTSGGKGYHVLLPFQPDCGWQTFGDFAKAVANLLQAQWPQLYTSTMKKEQRKNKIFVDWMRNGKGATCVAPYSIRARRGAKISMPIGWSELDKIAPDQIDITTALARIKKKDPWEDFFQVRQSISYWTEKEK